MTSSAAACRADAPGGRSRSGYGRLAPAAFGVAAGLAIAALSGSLAMPAAAADLDLPFRVAAGDRSAIEIHRERDQRQAGRMVKQVVATTPAVAEVTERLPAGWVMVWSYGQSVIADGDVAVELADRTLATIADGLRLEFTTDDRGAPLQIRNGSEVRRHVRGFAARYVNTIVHGGRGGGTDLAEVARLRREARDQIAPLLRMNDAQLGAFVLDDPHLLNGISGRRHSTTAPVETVVEAIDALSGAPVRYLDRTKVRSVDPRGGLAIIDWARQGDAGTPAAGQAGPWRWTAIYTVRVETGLAESVSAERTLSAGGVEIVERTTISRSRSAVPSPR